MISKINNKVRAYNGRRKTTETDFAIEAGEGTTQSGRGEEMRWCGLE